MVTKVNKYFWLLIFSLCIAAALIGICSCNSTKDTITGCKPKVERKALRHIGKALQCPAAFAPTCASLYPGKDSVHESTVYTVPDTMVISDTVTKYDSSTRTYTRTIANTKTITITIKQYYYVRETNTAAIEAEKQKTKAAEIKAARDLLKQKMWLNICMWGFIVCGGILLLLFIKWIVGSKIGA